MNSDDVARLSTGKVLILDGNLNPVLRDLIDISDFPIAATVTEAPVITIEYRQYDIDSSLDAPLLSVRNRRERRALSSSRTHPAGWKPYGGKQRRA